MTALVLGLTENGYGILRALARENIPVLGFYQGVHSFGRFSRLCTAHALEVDEYGSLQQASLTTGICRNSQGVLFPTSDDLVAAVIRDQERLSEHFLYHWLPPSLWRDIVDKTWMFDAARKAGILVPRTRTTRENEDIEAEAGRFAFPIIVKPVRSADVRFPTGLKNYVAQSVQDLIGFYGDSPRALGATIWQEVIDGGDDQIFQCNVLIRRDGEVGAHVCVRKLRQYMPGYGVMCFGRSERNDALLSESLKLLRSLDYRGLASLEFKRSVLDERFYFIEMNPRLPWYNSLFAVAGVNLASLAYRDLTGARLSDVRPQRDNVYWVALRQDLGHKLHSRSNSIRWFRSLFRARSWAWWDLSDPLPFWNATCEFVKNGLGRAVRIGKSP